MEASFLFSCPDGQGKQGHHCLPLLLPVLPFLGKHFIIINSPRAQGKARQSEGTLS